MAQGGIHRSVNLESYLREKPRKIQMSDEPTYSELVTADNPELQNLKLSWATAVFTADDGLASMTSMHEAGDSIVAVGMMNDEGLIILGSGVMIGPGLLLTATHVLEEISQHKKTPIFFTFLPKTSRIWLPFDTSTVSGPSDFGEDRRKISDLSLVSCTLNSRAHSELPLMLTPLQVALPLVGERLWAFGYRHQLIIDGAASITPFVSSGLVTEAFPHGRGERMPSPCLEVQMDTLGGMSGGPVVNSDGKLVGIVSSSIDGGPSFITLIWDALRFDIKGTIPLLKRHDDTNLIQAMHLGLVKISGDFERKPWGDIVFEMSADESAFMERSCDPELLLQKKDRLTKDEIEKFIDDWGYELEQAATSKAIEYLNNLSAQAKHDVLGVSGITEDCLNLIEDFVAEDFEGIEDPDVNGIERINSSELNVDFYFNLLSVYWTVRVTKENYKSNEHLFSGHFINQTDDGDHVVLEIMQRLHFRGDFVFDLVDEDVNQSNITWLGVQKPKRRIRDLPIAREML